MLRRRAGWISKITRTIRSFFHCHCSSHLMHAILMGRPPRRLATQNRIDQTRSSGIMVLVEVGATRNGEDGSPWLELNCLPPTRSSTVPRIYVSVFGAFGAFWEKPLGNRRVRSRRGGHEVHMATNHFFEHQGFISKRGAHRGGSRPSL